MSAKKSILVVFTGSMELGGIERSLLGLLESFDYNKYDIDVFLYGHHGPLFEQLDRRANLLPEVKELAYLRESFGMKIRNKCYYSAWLRLRDEIKGKFTTLQRDNTWGEIVEKCVPQLNKHYDLALGFFRPFDVLAEKVDATIKVGWIHTDYTKAGENLDLLRQDYKRMDYIAAVSKQCGHSFANLFPEFQDKIIVVENTLSSSLIQNQANENMELEWHHTPSIKLLSIGRFCNQKNFDNVPFICKLIRQQGLDVKWYLIGYGGDEALIRENIREQGMEDHVIILGKKENPYPYIKACDVYVQPSRYEGKCVAVREAQMLGKPVIITNYATSASQLEDGVDGVIVPMDNEGCARGITEVLHNPQLMERLAENCRQRDYSNSQEVEKIYQLMKD